MVPTLAGRAYAIFMYEECILAPSFRVHDACCKRRTALRVLQLLFYDLHLRTLCTQFAMKEKTQRKPFLCLQTRIPVTKVGTRTGVYFYTTIGDKEQWRGKRTIIRKLLGCPVICHVQDNVVVGR